MAAITVRELLTRLGVQTDEAAVKSFDTSVGRAKRTMEESSAAASRMAGAVKAAIIGFIGVQTIRVFKSALDEFAAAADKARKASEAMGVSVETYQELAFAAELSGTSIDRLSMAMGRVAKSARDAATGQKKDKEAFDELGVSVKDANGNLKNQDVLLKEIASKFAALEDGTTKTALAIEFFGRSGTELIPMLNAGAEGIEAMQEEARALGLVISEEAARNTEAYNDAVARLNGALSGMRALIFSAVIPVLTDVIQAFVEWWIRTKAAIRITDAFKGALQSLSDTLAFLRKHSQETEIAVAALVAAMAVAHAQQFTTAILAAAKAVRLLGQAAILPAIKLALIAAAILLVILIVNDLVVFMRGGDSLIGRLFERFGVAPGVIRRVRDRIRTTLAALFEWGKRVGASLLQSFMGAVRRVVPVILEAVKRLMPVIESFAARAVPLVTKLFEIWINLNAMLVEASIEILSALVPVVLEIVQELIAIGVALLPAVIDVVESIMTTVKELLPIVMDIAKEVFDVVVDAIDAILPVVMALLDLIVPNIKMILTVSITTLKGVLAVVMPVVRVLLKIVKFLAEVFVKTVAFLLDVWDAFVNAIVWLWAAIGKPILEVWGNIRTAIVAIIQFIANIFNTVINSIIVVVNSLIESVSSIAEAVGLDVVSTISADAIRIDIPDTGPTQQSFDIGDISLSIEGQTNMGADAVKRAAGDGLTQALREASRAAG